MELTHMWNILGTPGCVRVDTSMWKIAHTGILLHNTCTHLLFLTFCFLAACSQAHIHMCICSYLSMHTCRHAVYTYLGIHTHNDTNACKQSHLHTHTHAHTRIEIHRHTHARTIFPSGHLTGTPSQRVTNEDPGKGQV